MSPRFAIWAALKAMIALGMGPLAAARARPPSWAPLQETASGGTCPAAVLGPVLETASGGTYLAAVLDDLISRTSLSGTS